MAFQCGFFDSTTSSEVGGFIVGNKAKDAAFFAKREAAIIGNGVYDGSFEVTPSSGLGVSRSAGKGWINGYFCYDDSAHVKLLTANATHYYVLRLHLGDGEITEQWLTTYTTPVRVGNTYDLLLAVITIPSGTVNVTAAMITDYRNDVTNCGYAQLQPNMNFETITVTAGRHRGHGIENDTDKDRRRHESLKGQRRLRNAQRRFCACIRDKSNTDKVGRRHEGPHGRRRV